MTLLEESDEFALIVSPYVKVLKWHKLIKKLENLKRRNIPHQFIIRDDVKGNFNSYNELEELQIEYIAIPNLHCKLYMNEKYAIVSSMNLLFSSEINSIELAYQTETDEEYLELKTFCERHLGVDFNINEDSQIEHGTDEDWRDLVYQTLSNSINSRVILSQKDGGLNINTTKNNYAPFIWNSKVNRLRVSGVLTQKEYDFLFSNMHVLPKIEGLKFEIVDGRKKHYNTIWGTFERPLNTRHLDEADPKESYFLADSIVQFVLAVDEFKWSM